METWNRPTNLRGKGVREVGKRLIKNLIYIFALSRDPDNKVVKD